MNLIDLLLPSVIVRQPDFIVIVPSAFTIKLLLLLIAMEFNVPVFILSAEMVPDFIRLALMQS